MEILEIKHLSNKILIVASQQVRWNNSPTCPHCSEVKHYKLKTKGEKLNILKVKRIIEEDDGSNWDMHQSYDIEELIDMLDDGFGILNLSTAK